MNQMQEHFNTVWEKVVAPSYDTVSDTCLYNGPHGRRCAFGVLLTPEELATIPEGLVVFDLFRKGQLPQRFRENWKFYESLQNAHDTHAGRSSTFLEKFRAELRDIARNYQLEIPQ